MADNYIDRLTAMNGKYRLGESTFAYIGQVKISLIIKGRDLEPEFNAFVSDVTKTFVVELPEVILLPHLDNKVDCIAFINCRDNNDHLRIIGLFDDRMFRGKRLAAKPNGFTNTRFEPVGDSKYRTQRRMVSLFNQLNYPGSRNPALTSSIDTSRAHLYTAANRETNWDPPSRKRTYISRVESNHTIQKATKVEVKTEVSDEEQLVIDLSRKRPITYGAGLKAYVRDQLDVLVMRTLIYFLVLITSIQQDIPLD